MFSSNTKNGNTPWSSASQHIKAATFPPSSVQCQKLGCNYWVYRSYNSLYYVFPLINTQLTSLRRVPICLPYASSRIVSNAFTAHKTDLLSRVPFQIQIWDNCLSTVPPAVMSVTLILHNIWQRQGLEMGYINSFPVRFSSRSNA